MKFVIAPDSFKESLSAVEVARAIGQGIKLAIPNAIISKIPIADGGEGTVDAILTASGGTRIRAEVTDPLGNTIESFFGLLPDQKTAVIELAAASGLHLVPSEMRNPLVTTTKGTGELIRAALDYGVDEIILGIGGSATNDCGAGILQALGVKLLDEKNVEIPYGGGFLTEIKKIDVSGLDPRIKNVSLTVACDVSNPLIGRNGASAIYGPQKGATETMIEKLDSNLLHFGRLIEKELNKNIIDIPGAGAAGGVGAALLSFFDAHLKPGINLIMELTELEGKIKDADFVITGEGKLDGQTFQGKAPSGIAKIAKKYDKPVYVIAGMIEDGYEALLSTRVDAAFSITNGPMTLEEAKNDSFNLIKQTAMNIARLIQSCR
jgi:glycerate 2-kinase